MQVGFVVKFYELGKKLAQTVNTSFRERQMLLIGFVLDEIMRNKGEFEICTSFLYGFLME